VEITITRDTTKDAPLLEKLLGSVAAIFGFGEAHDTFSKNNDTVSLTLSDSYSDNADYPNSTGSNSNGEPQDDQDSALICFALDCYDYKTKGERKGNVMDEGKRHKNVTDDGKESCEDKEGLGLEEFLLEDAQAQVKRCWLSCPSKITALKQQLGLLLQFDQVGKPGGEYIAELIEILEIEEIPGFARNEDKVRLKKAQGATKERDKDKDKDKEKDKAKDKDKPTIPSPSVVEVPRVCSLYKDKEGEKATDKDKPTIPSPPVIEVPRVCSLYNDEEREKEKDKYEPMILPSPSVVEVPSVCSSYKDKGREKEKDKYEPMILPSPSVVEVPRVR